MEDRKKYELPSERRSRELERQTQDTGSEPGPDSHPTLPPSSPTCSPHPTGSPTASTLDQMRTRIRELRCLVEQLEEEMRLLRSADTVEPVEWSSVALTLREVANRSLLLRQQALSLVVEALGLDRQTSGTLGFF